MFLTFSRNSVKLHFFRKQISSKRPNVVLLGNQRRTNITIESDVTSSGSKLRSSFVTEKYNFKQIYRSKFEDKYRRCPTKDDRRNIVRRVNNQLDRVTYRENEV